MAACLDGRRISCAYFKLGPMPPRQISLPSSVCHDLGLWTCQLELGTKLFSLLILQQIWIHRTELVHVGAGAQGR